MTIDIEKLIMEVDEDGSGEIEFDEFKTLLQSEWKSINTNSKKDKFIILIIIKIRLISIQIIR